MHARVALLATLVGDEYPARQTRVTLLSRHARQALTLARHRVTRHSAVRRAFTLPATLRRVAIVAALALVAATSANARLAAALTSRLVALIAVHGVAAVAARAAVARSKAIRVALKTKGSKLCIYRSIYCTFDE